MSQLALQTTRIFNLLDLYCYSFVVLCIIGFKTYMNEDRDSSQSRLFRILLALNAALLFVDGLSTGINGQGGFAARILLEYISVANFSLQTLVAYIWVRFVCEVSSTKTLSETASRIILALPLFAVIAMLLATPFASIGFAYDGLNHYRRTFGTYFIIATDFAYILIAYVIAIRERHENGRKKTTALLSFALAPALCAVLQLFLPNVTLAWPALTISLLINYLAIQNEQLFLDHLTGINNRRSLDITLKKKLAAPRNSGLFGLLFIDLDDFKSINDTYGHIEGDHALEATAQILQKCFLHSDFISRYGGDEFLIIVDLKNKNDLDAIKQRLEEHLAGWNESSGNPWKLSFSIGSVSCDQGEACSSDDYLRQIDMLLYEHKRAKKGN